MFLARDALKWAFGSNTRTNGTRLEVDDNTTIQTYDYTAATSVSIGDDSGTGATAAATTTTAEPNTEFYDQHDMIISFEHFERLDETYNLRRGETLEFYYRVMDVYQPYLLSCGDNPDDLMRTVNAFIDQYLAYLYPMSPSSSSSSSSLAATETDSLVEIAIDRPSTVCFPWLYYQPLPESNERHCFTVDGDECSTFLVNSKLDFIYASVMEMALVDILRRKENQLYNERRVNWPSFLGDCIVDLDANVQYYRDQALFTYKGSGSDAVNALPLGEPSPGQDDGYDNDPDDIFRQSTPSTTTTTTTTTTTPPPPTRYQSHEMVIYTKRSSSFYTWCHTLLHQTNDAFVTFSEETMRNSVIPFQQVLLFCGKQTGFIAKHCIESPSPNDAFVSVAADEMNDWLVLPIWLYLLWHLESTRSSTKQ
jgi:hypothetical protein